MLIPFTAVSSGLSIFIPLYIIYMNGSVLDISIAFALYNLISIPSSIFWGKITDRYRRIKPFIIFSIFGTLPLLFAFILVHNVYSVFIEYAIFAVIATASSPAINILVMGTKRSRNLPKHFSRYSIFGLSGSTLAFIFGIFIGSNNLLTYVYFLIIFEFVALIIGYALIKEDTRVMANTTEIKHVNKLFPILNTITKLPNMLVSGNTIIHLHNTIKNFEKKRVYQLLGAIVLFNVGYYLFNTSYIPYLKLSGLDYSSIFIINMLNGLAQICIFLMIIRIRKGFRLGRWYTKAIAYRSLSYVIALISMFIPSLFFQANIIAYIIAGLSYAIWNLSSSVLLYNIIRGDTAGYYVGIWTGLLGGSAVFGAIMSGIVSLYLGYQVTFIFAILMTIASGILFNKKFNVRIIPQKKVIIGLHT